MSTRKQNSERSQPKPWHADQSKNQKAVNIVSGDKSRNSRPQSNRGGRSERNNRGWGDNGGRKVKILFYFFHGKDKGHWINECPVANKKKEEFNCRDPQPAKPVNYTSQNSQLRPTASTHQWPSATAPHRPSTYSIFNYNPLPNDPLYQCCRPLRRLKFHLPPLQHNITRGPEALPCRVTCPHRRS